MSLETYLNRALQGDCGNVNPVDTQLIMESPVSTSVVFPGYQKANTSMHVQRVRISTFALLIE